MSFQPVVVTTDKLVKTPVIVGRKDDRTDALTKLTDGVTCSRPRPPPWPPTRSATGAQPVNPVMLVVAKTIADANEYGEILRSIELYAIADGQADPGPDDRPW